MAVAEFSCFAAEADFGFILSCDRLFGWDQKNNDALVNKFEDIH
jgi:hypothetical protein